MLHSRRHGDRQRGQILVLFELVLIVILGLAALVIDGGVLRNNRQILVNTLDAAALASGSILPVDNSVPGHTATDATNLITSIIQADYPGLPSSNYTIAYKCLVGVDPSTNLAWVSRDIPAACDTRPSLGLGNTLPPASGFIGAGPTRVAPCNPVAGDTCNVVVITGSATTQYKLAPVIGLTSGSTGTVVSAACNGPCGASPVVPVDLVIILDRTLSMQGNDSSGHNKIQNLKDAANAVLGVYDPSKQRVALGLTGPSEVDGSGNPIADCGNTTPKAYGTADNSNFFPNTNLSGASTTLGGVTANTTLAGATFSTTIAGTPFTTTLTTALTNLATATTVKVASATGLPATPFIIQIDNERMQVTTKVGTTLTVTRAYDGTTRVAHALNATVTFIAESSTDTTIAVTSATGFPAAPFTIQVDSGANAETMQVTAKSGTNLTVTRGTPASAHAPGVSVAWGGGIAAGDTSITVASAAGFPATPFTIQVDTGANAETMLVSNKNGGTTWTVQRGYDGTTARAHSGGVSISWGGTIGSADTTINVASASGFPSVPFSIQVDTGGNLEGMRVTAMGGTNNTTWTVTRGYDSTTARKHASGVAVTTMTGAADTTINVTAPPTGWFPTSAPFNILIDSEQMTVTALSGTTWTVTRHTNGSTAARHTNGAAIQNLSGWVPNDGTSGVWVPVGLSGTNSTNPPANPGGTSGDYTNTNSPLVTSINCIQASSIGTNLATPIAMAHWYLNTYGRPGVVKGILLETDGQPQDATVANGLDNPAFTCNAANNEATSAKADGIKIYTVGYGAGSNCPTTGTNSSESAYWSGKPATTLLQTLATGTTAPYYFNQPTGASLADDFKQAATSLAHTGAHLVQLYPAPIVSSANGSSNSVTVTGEYFTGTTSVTFGGAAGTAISVTGDTSLTVKAPAAPSGSKANVVVTTGGGSSAITSLSVYTYP